MPAILLQKVVTEILLRTYFFSSLLRSRFGMQNFLRGSVSYLHEPRINTFEDADECDILRMFLELLICNSKRQKF